MRNVAIVGGRGSFIKDTLGPSLAKHGLEVIGHVPYKEGRKPPPIPEAAEGVIIITTANSHGMSAPMKERAVARGLPVVSVPHKWALAEKVLREHKWIPEEKEKPVPPSEDAVDGFIVGYLTEARRKGRTPSYQEVETVVAKEYASFEGAVCCSHEQYDRCVSKASAMVPLAPAPPVSEDLAEALREWTRAILVECPETILDEDDLTKQVISVAVPANATAPTDATKIVTETVKEVRKSWQTMTDERTRVMGAFLVRWFQRWRRGEAAYPAYREVMPTCKAVFGASPLWDNVRVARAEALGSWALDTIEVNEAQRYLLRRCQELGLEPFDVRTALDEGVLKGIVLPPNKRYTSKEAIDEHLTALTKPVETIEVAEPVKPEPIIVPPQPAGSPPSRAVITDVAMEVAVLLQDSITATLNTILQPIEQRLAAIEAKVTAQDARIGQVAEALNLMADATGELDKTVKGLSDQSNVLSSEVKALKEQDVRQAVKDMLAAGKLKVSLDF